MRRGRSFRRATHGLLATAALWCCAAVVAAQAPSPRPPLAEDVFKNVQVLRGIPVDEFMGTMGFFSAALGLNCTDCHVDESGGSWARYADDNDLKRTARRMTLMVQSINRTNFGGRQVVTCNTCHRGSRLPNVMPSLNLLYGAPPPDEPGDPFEQAPGQPAPDAILDKYLEAAGGAARAASLKSLVGKGTYRGFDDPDASPMDFYATADRQRAIVAHVPSGDTSWVVSRGEAFLAGPPSDRPVPVMAITGQELEGLQVEVAAFFPSLIRSSLRNWRVGVPALLENDEEVAVLQGETAGGAVVTLCFDQKTGMLRRLIRYASSPVGRLVTRVDYTAYRDVAGVRVPSGWTVSWLSGRSVFTLTDIQANAAIDAARFARPAPR